MGLKEATITLDNEWNTYYAGQSVTGRIEYVFDSPKKVRGIHVKFKGEAHTEWTESEQRETADGKTESTDKRLVGNEEYFQIQYYLLGSNSGNEIEIPAGRHIYNFQCALPPVLPSSFEGEFGHVRYTIKVTLDRPWKFDQETKMAFTVITPLDLNLNPSYRQPIHMQMEKTFCCLCCTSAPLQVDVQSPVSGYCPGQCIPVRINVDNKSNVQLHLVKVFLRKLVTYRATSPSTAIKKNKEIVVTMQEGPVPAGITKIWNINMEVPPVPPSNLVNCSIIDLDYDLKVECGVSGLHTNLKDRKYVTIGTVPLVGGATAPTAPPGDGQPALLPVNPGPQAGEPGWQAPSAPGGQPPHMGLYPSLAEPIYKPGTFSARSIADKTDSQHTAVGPAFAPNYPTYIIQPPALPQ